ncbi:unnamed protein product [Haemonchus placei]|uniref:BTB_2 domain-containing protein n=1 Tax=Haemonchus placei TaxID=6290 RepID=A0A0N4X0X7_HAEPC|nr:unnamed protein product [Haemonchus placei]
MSEVVVLNVGGEKFSTSQKTLGRKSLGEVFIDRDSTVFKYILNYLRNAAYVQRVRPGGNGVLFRIHNAVITNLSRWVRRLNWFWGLVTSHLSRFKTR